MGGLEEDLYSMDGLGVDLALVGLLGHRLEDLPSLVVVLYNLDDLVVGLYFGDGLEVDHVHLVRLDLLGLLVSMTYFGSFDFELQL